MYYYNLKQAAIADITCLPEFGIKMFRYNATSLTSHTTNTKYDTLYLESLDVDRLSDFSDLDLNDYYVMPISKNRYSVRFHNLPFYKTTKGGVEEMSNALRTVKNGAIGYADSLQTYGINTLIGKVKNTIGKEFYINNAVALKGQKFKKFMELTMPRLYDKYLAEDEMSFIPFVDVTEIIRGCFMFVASGRYIPGKMQDAILEERNNATLYIYIFGFNKKALPKIISRLDKCIKRDNIDNATNTIYVVNKVGANYDIVSMGFDARALDTLVYSHNEKQLITNHLDKFSKNMEFYKSKSITYKTGVLLYGEPGTGKSSLVKALATQYHRNICQVSVATLDEIDFSILTIMLNQDDDKYIVLFEDIDTLFLNRDDKKNADKDYQSIINKLLQFLDSNTSPSDVIFIATTNHIERLDDALLREGRFDIKVNVGALEKGDVKKFMDLLECKYDLDYVLETYGDAKNGLYNQSRLQNIIVRGKEDEGTESEESSVVQDML